MIKAQTVPLYGVSAGVALYTANNLGANDVNTPGYTHLDALPMNPSDAFMIPSTFQAVTAQVTPIHNVQIIGIRAFRFENHIQADCHRYTLLNQNPIYPNMPDNMKGTLAFGVKAHWQSLKSAAWFYQFYAGYHGTFIGDRPMLQYRFS